MAWLTFRVNSTFANSFFDARTVKLNMDSGAMTTPEQFKDDMMLTFANAMKYNPPEHDVHKMAKALNELFVSKWEKEEDSIKQKWRLESSGGHHTPSAPGAHSESVGQFVFSWFDIYMSSRVLDIRR